MTTDPNASAYPDPTHARPSAHTADRVARVVTELGAGWAQVGLTMGRLALRQSARALEATSDLLGVVAERVERYAAPREPVADEPAQADPAAPSADA